MAAGATAATCPLGVDNTAAAPRRRLKKASKKAARLRAAMARRVRLDNIRKAGDPELGTYSGQDCSPRPHMTRPFGGWGGRGGHQASAPGRYNHDSSGSGPIALDDIVVAWITDGGY